MSDIRKQIEACLTSDLLEEAKLVWIYLLACRPSGAGARGLSQALGFNVEEAVEILSEEKLASLKVLHHGGAVWKANKYAGAAKKAKRGDEPVSVHERAQKFVKVYQRLRKAAIGRQLTINSSHSKHFDSIADWLEENEVTSIRFMKFAIDRSDWLEDKMPFPTPSFLSGPWIREQWADNRDTSRASGARAATHAGKDYGEADESTKSKLQRKGLDVSGLEDSQLRYIESCATSAKELGEIMGVGEEWVPYVRALLEDES